MYNGFDRQVIELGFNRIAIVILFTLYTFLSCKTKREEIVPDADKVVYTATNKGDVYAVDAKTGQKIWQYSTGSNTDSSPIVANGQVYFGDLSGKLYAIDALTGQEKWRLSLDASILSSPIVSDSTLYVGNYGPGGPVGSGLYAVDAATGRRIWRYPVSTSSSPCVSDGNVYFTSYDNNLYALDAKSGKLKWKYTSEDGLSSSPVCKNGIVFLIDRKSFIAFDAATGQVKWSYKSKFSKFYHMGSPAIVGNTIYFIEGERGLTALDMGTGGMKWNFDFGPESTVNPTPAVLSGKIYIQGQAFVSTAADGSGDRIYKSKLYAFDRETGMQTWDYTSQNEFKERYNMILPVPTAGINAIYINSQDGHIYAIDPETGKQTWQFDTGSYIRSTPCVVSSSGEVNRGLGQVSL